MIPRNSPRKLLNEKKSPVLPMGRSEFVKKISLWLGLPGIVTILASMTYIHLEAHSQSVKSLLLLVIFSIISLTLFIFIGKNMGQFYWARLKSIDPQFNVDSKRNQFIYIVLLYFPILFLINNILLSSIKTGGLDGRLAKVLRRILGVFALGLIVVLARTNLGELPFHNKDQFSATSPISKYFMDPFLYYQLELNKNIGDLVRISKKKITDPKLLLQETAHVCRIPVVHTAWTLKMIIEINKTKRAISQVNDNSKIKIEHF